MTAPHRDFHATDAEAGQTILAGLRSWLPGASWSAVRHEMAARRVLINQVLCLDENRRLKPGDVVSVLNESRPKPPTSQDVRIVFRDESLVVVEKPAGMLTQRRTEEQTWSREKRSLQPVLEEILPELLQRGPRKNSNPRSPASRPVRRVKPIAIWSVHRLDRDASGLLVIALTHEVAQALIAQFADHSARRIYWAIIPGTLNAQTLQSNFTRDRGDGLRGSLDQSRPASLPAPGLLERAVTHVRPLETVRSESTSGSVSEWTWLECRLETGRTNQIRIHLSEAGHPICGDIKFRGPMGQPIDDPSGVPRMMLHAAELGLIHPITGKPLRFQSPWPENVRSVLTGLGFRTSFR